MNLVQLLNSFESKLNTLSIFEKVQVYLLPILLGIFVVYNFVDIKKESAIQTVTVLTKNSVEYNQFLKDLEQFAQEHSLVVLNIKQNGIKSNLNVEGNFSDLLAFILFCESYQSVNAVNSLKLSLNQDKLTLLIDFEFSVNKLTPKNYENIQTKLLTILSPFKQQKGTLAEESFAMHAIVNNEVLINNTWLKKGDIVWGMQIKEISLHYIVLLDNHQQEKVLYLRKE